MDDSMLSHHIINYKASASTEGIERRIGTASGIRRNFVDFPWRTPV
jgi:hypothetical protein